MPAPGGKSSRGRTFATAALALLALGLAVGAGIAYLAEAGTDCEEFRFDREAWERARAVRPTPDENPAEQERRRLANGLVECGLLDGATKTRVRSLLGAPDRAEIDASPVRHRDWEYDVGPDRNASDSSDEVEHSLFLQLDLKGRVRYTEAPPRSSEADEQELATSGVAIGEPRVVLPRVEGLRRDEATALLRSRNLRWRFVGGRPTSGGVVRGQRPSPGKDVLQGYRIALETEVRCDEGGIPSGFWPRRSGCRSGRQPRDY